VRAGGTAVAPGQQWGLEHSRRGIVDAVLFVVRPGRAWRQLLAGFPPFVWNLI
jgi:hypothetical protein